MIGCQECFEDPVKKFMVLVLLAELVNPFSGKSLIHVHILLPEGKVKYCIGFTLIKYRQFANE